jgi:glycosyltransferase involved in cell wall biosynthesis
MKSVKATAILLNYKKKDSLIKAIQSIRNQNIPIEIILIDNSQKDECRDLDVDHLITTTRNLHCKSRFLAANWASSDYIFTLDDDVLLSSSDVIEKYIGYIEELHKNEWIVMTDRNNHYSHLDPNYPKEFNKELSLTNYGKGRFLFFHKEYLSKVPIGYKDFITYEEKREITGLIGESVPDDSIGIDDLSFQKWARWVMFPKNFSSIEDQPTSGTGLQQKKGHFDIRWEWIRNNTRGGDTEPGEDKTELCYLFEKWGSDKCGHYFHTYSKEYWKLLHPIKDKVSNFIEIGVGAIDIMADRIVPGDKYYVGASLRAWNDFFTGANIWGLDIREDVLFERERIKCLWTDQSQSLSLENTIDRIRGLENKGDLTFEVIIDDGSHVVEHQITSIKTLSKYLSRGGYYIIEDIKDKDLGIFVGLSVEGLKLIRVWSEWIPKSPGQNSFVVYVKI